VTCDGLEPDDSTGREAAESRATRSFLASSKILNCGVQPYDGLPALEKFVYGMPNHKVSGS
jgi:hypothetical protein